jgi:hypothetical protein
VSALFIIYKSKNHKNRFNSVFCDFSVLGRLLKQYLILLMPIKHSKSSLGKKQVSGLISTIV